MARAASATPMPPTARPRTRISAPSPMTRSATLNAMWDVCSIVCCHDESSRERGAVLADAAYRPLPLPVSQGGVHDLARPPGDHVLGGVEDRGVLAPNDLFRLVAVDDRDAVRRIAEVHIAWLRRGVHLYDDTLPALRELRGRGMRTAIVSNCDHFTRPAVDALGLEDEVDTVLLSFEVGAMKPDAPIYEEALRRLAVDADQAIFVEDQADYCDGAEALGIRALRIEREGRSIRVGAGVRVRRDRIDKNGKVTLRHRTRLHHIGVGHAHKGKRVTLLVDGLDVRVLSEDGELLRHLTGFGSHVR